MHDFAVVGGGIAGLSVAELLQRSGRRVALIEAEPVLGSQASAQAQGWFHTGALYAALPTSRFFRTMIGNLDDLLNFYSGFPNMNLGAGRQLLAKRGEGWFGNSTMFYFYSSPRDPAIALWQKPIWQAAIQRAKARLSWFETIDFTREISPQVGAFTWSMNLRRNVVSRKFPFDLGPVACVLSSRDRAIDSTLLARDLLASFLVHGGEVKTNTAIERIEAGAVCGTNGTVKARNVVVASGRHVNKLADLGARSQKSPLMVVTPALSETNFIRMTPALSRSLTHVAHKGADGRDYSLFGNAERFDADETVDEAAVAGAFAERIGEIFGQAIPPERRALYFGYKTELSAAGSLRNYLYRIVDTGRCVVALPGKMSLAFSLAVNVCRHFGIDPITATTDIAGIETNALIAKSLHRRRYESLREGETDPPAAAERRLPAAEADLHAKRRSAPQGD